MLNQKDYQIVEQASELSKESLPAVTSDDNQPQNFLFIDDVFGNCDLSDLEQPENGINSFYTDVQTHHKKNSRIATRFIRDDIVVCVKVRGFFGFHRTIFVDLLDISSKGALISMQRKLGINKKITLSFQFKSGKIFLLKAIIVRHSGSSSYEYGVKFDRYNNELGDYLFETQEKLIFK